LNIDSAIFQTSSEQLHFSHIFVHLFVSHPVAQHADKIYIHLKLTEMYFEMQVAEVWTVET
jgi:hypothetical protein